jgi:hypothetical protein
MSDVTSTTPVVLRPLTVTTVTIVVFGVLFVALGLLFVLGPLAMEWSDPTSDKTDLSFLFGLTLTVPISGVGLVLLIRGTRRQLMLTEREAVLVELFRTYRIPRNVVTGLGSVYSGNGVLCPAIEWTDPKNHKKRSTKVSFLAPAALGSVGRSRLDAMRATLDRWCRP